VRCNAAEGIETRWGSIFCVSAASTGPKGTDDHTGLSTASATRWRPMDCGGEGEDRESPSICGERGERRRPCATGLFRGSAMQGSRVAV
jgi:hypothetical protein